MRIIILILILILLVSGVQAGTEYHDEFDLSPFDSVVSDGFTHQTNKVGMTSSGDLIIIPRTNAAATNCALKTNDWGSTWSNDRAITGIYTMSPYFTIACYGDSCFYIGNGRSNSDYVFMGKYVGDTRTQIGGGGYYDTITTVLGATPKTYTAPMLKLHGNKILALCPMESGSPDSTAFQLSDGQLVNTMTWTEYDTVNIAFPGFKTSFEWSAGCKGGFISFSSSDRDLYWFDTIASTYKVIDTDFTPYNDNNFCSYEIIWFKDSFGLAVYQIAAASDIRLKYFKVSAAGNTPGTATAVNVNIDSATINDVADEQPADAFTFPTISMVYNSSGITDTGYVFYKRWADDAVPDSFSICYKQFILNGVSGISSVGDCQTMLASAGANKLNGAVNGLQSPPKIYNVNDEHLLAVAYVDSGGADLTKLYVLLEKVDVSSAGTETGQVIIISMIDLESPIVGTKMHYFESIDKGELR